VLFRSAMAVVALGALSSVNGLQKFCPQAKDLVETWRQTSAPSIYNQGWSIQGGGGVATKSAFNLLGGYVEYDIDLSQSRTGVNSNIYTISPKSFSKGSQGYTPGDYCDAQKYGSQFCLEVDWIESNGNCGGSTTLHTVEGPGSNGCTQWGCHYDYHYNGKNSFHMRIEYAKDGTWTVIRNGEKITYAMENPHPTSYDSGIIADYNNKYGSVITSTQWTGWVPVEDCGTRGDLASSKFSIKNLVIYGTVKQGPTPATCTSIASNSTDA